MTHRAAKRLLIIGWDAADWQVIDPLLKRGAMPNLARLLKAGARADLETLEPRLSPILWTSIATGKHADQHGILNFVEPDPSSAGGTGLRISSSTTRKTKALWNILTQAGLRVNVVSWYASHPAEPISGVCVSNLFQEGTPRSAGADWPVPAGSVHPAEMAGAVGAARVHPGAIRPHQLLSMIPGLSRVAPSDPRIAALVKAVAQCQSVHQAALAALRADGPWDCSMVFYDAIDVAGHHFMQYHPPRMDHVSKADFELFKGVMGGVYRLQDTLLGELLDAAGEGVTVMLLSDHGFHSDRFRPPPDRVASDDHAVMDAAWHRTFGVLALSGPGIRRGAVINSPRLLDIAPTALNLLGLPAGEDMRGRALSEALDPPPEIPAIPSWDEVEGAAGMHPPDLRHDPFEATEAMKQLVDLGYMAAPAGDERGFALMQNETRYNLAVVLMTSGRPDDATALFEELHRAQPEHPRYALSYARCCMERGRFAVARQVLGGFLRAVPRDTRARLALSAAHLAENQYAEAAAVLEELDRDIPRSDAEGRAALDQQLGMTYILLRRPGEARRVFSRALTADPRSPNARHGMGLAALGQRRFEEAVEHCLAALADSPAYPDAHYTLGVALAWMDDLEHAVKSFKVALAIQPGLIDAHRFLAAIYLRRKDAERRVHHQETLERLIRERVEAGGSSAPFSHEPPMGPEEWAARASASGTKA